MREGKGRKLRVFLGLEEEEGAVTMEMSLETGGIDNKLVTAWM